MARRSDPVDSGSFKTEVVDICQPKCYCQGNKCQPTKGRARMTEKISLSDGEWKLMNLLWEEAPRTITQLVEALKDDTGWTKGTIFIMLSRMSDKGAVRFESGERSKFYYPVLKKEDAAFYETESFLSKVYGGSVGLMVASMAEQKVLSKEDIDELYAILRDAEKEADQ